MVLRRFAPLVFGAIAALGGTQCGPPSDPDLVCNPSPAAVPATQVWSLVMADAACFACHHLRSDNPFDFSSGPAFRASTVEVTSKYGPGLMLIHPRDLVSSTLWLKVLGGSDTGKAGPRGENVGGRMPPDGGWPLTPESLTALKDWICTGASL